MTQLTNCNAYQATNLKLTNSHKQINIVSNLMKEVLDKCLHHRHPLMISNYLENILLTNT